MGNSLCCADSGSSSKAGAELLASIESAEEPSGILSAKSILEYAEAQEAQSGGRTLVSGQAESLAQ